MPHLCDGDLYESRPEHCGYYMRGGLLHRQCTRYRDQSLLLGGSGFACKRYRWWIRERSSESSYTKARVPITFTTCISVCFPHQTRISRYPLCFVCVWGETSSVAPKDILNCYRKRVRFESCVQMRNELHNSLLLDSQIQLTRYRWCKATLANDYHTDARCFIYTVMDWDCRCP